MPHVTRLAPAENSTSLRAANVVPETWNESDLSVDVVWTTGASVTRFDWRGGGYYEETLGTETGHVRLDRLQAGGPVLLDHVGSTGALAGSIVPGSVRMAKGKGLARIRLSDTPDMSDVVAKVRAGHLRTISVGYRVFAYELIEAERADQMDRMHAVDWEPHEISLTPVPADAGATIRKRSIEMPNIQGAERDAERTNDERGHIYGNGRASHLREATEAQIIRHCSRARLSRDFERELIERHESEPMTEAQLQQAIIDRFCEERALPGIDASLYDQRDRDSSVSLRSAFADTLYARLSRTEPSASAREYAGASLVDMARALLEARGERARWNRPSQVIDQVLRHGQHTTSDFAYILGNASRRHLIDVFNAAASPLKALARKRDFTDFRMRYAIQAEGPGMLRHVPENAEFKRVSFKETQTGYSLGTYGEIFGISRQALINDDLSAFSQMEVFWARAQAETEASFFAAMIAGTGGQTLEDGLPLYHANHGNLAAAGSELNLASVSAARLQMRQMKNLDGQTLANVVPKYLVVGPAKETAAQQFLATINPALTVDVNPFAGQLELLVEPRLTGNSWRLFADPTIHPVLEYGNLEGQDGLFTDTRVGFDVDGVDFKARMDLGVGILDYRGTYMNPGD